MHRPIGIDLFAGAGGLSLGFEQAGFDVVAAVEIDPIHCATHEFNFPDCTTICGDVRRLSGQYIRQVAELGNREIDVVFGGAPCQGFSMIGKRALDDPRNRLVREFARLTHELRARYFVFENVKGLTVGKHRGLLDELVDEFDNLGYRVKLPYQVLNAAAFGVPQDRRRLFLLGWRKGLPEIDYPQPRTRPCTKGKVGDLFLQLGPSVWDAIGDLPKVEDYPELLSRDWSRVRFAKPSLYAMNLRGSKVGDDDYSYRRKWEPHVLTSSLRTIHTKESKQRFRATRPGKVEPISRFLKLDPKGISNTLRAGTGSDRGAYTSPRPIHPFALRCITVREAARLHSYPDWFRFHSTKWHGFRQIGNSVPPLLGRAVASKVIEAFDISPQRPRARLPLGNEDFLNFTMAEAAEYYQVPSDVVGRRLRLAVNE
ncbi:MAG: DNA cytosine methyltransferase [Betaproteobacteria bacterium]|nr:DNA cytosine methyltransferase [Betaproteobacteria bacterium]